MINAYDIAYGFAVGITAPLWAARGQSRRKVIAAFRERMGRLAPREGDEPAVMIHAVSMGEINATRAMVSALADALPELRFIISTTTDTGFAQGQQLYGADPRVCLIRYPLDFSSAVRRVLDLMRPSIVVLMELEVWPNFVRECERRGIPVVLVNGRLTVGSFRNYRLGGGLVKRMFARLAAVCAQDDICAERFISLGTPPQHVRVTGTMKFDTAQVAEHIDGDMELAKAVGLQPGKEPIIVCGSTGPGEEQMILDIYRTLDPKTRLVIVPRKPQRFDEVEFLIRGSAMNVIRRSRATAAEDLSRLRDNCIPPVVLGDTMGELRKFYSLADVVIVGRTLVDLGARQHGSDMIEPSALGKPVIVGPFTGNFAEVMNRFRDGGAIREVADPSELKSALEDLLGDRPAAQEMGRRAQQIVRQEQGATGRNVAVILEQLRNAGNPLTVSSRAGPAVQPNVG